jgi:type I restriction enzyme, S subunit
MKAGWEIKRIGDICKTSSGGTPLKIHKDYYEGGETPWLLSGEVSQMNIFSSKNFITQKGLNNSSAKLFPSDTVLVAMYGANAGHVGILRFESATNQAVCGIFPNNRVITEFLYYYLFLKQEDLAAQAVGGAQPNISQAKIKDTVIPVPPLPEQRRIVAILDEAFAGIAAAKEKVEQNLKNAKEVFEAYLQDTFKQFISGENGIPLNNLCELIVDCEHKTAPTGDGLEYPLIRTPNIGKGELVLDNVKTVSHENYLKWTRRAIPQEEDLILAREAPAGNIAVIPKNIKVCLGQRTVLLRTKKNKLFSRYLAYLMLSKDVQMKLLEHSRGATVQHINMKDIRLFKIYDLLHLDKQRQIVSELDNLSAETSVLESLYQQKLANLEELKKSLLQQAFSGAL